MMLPTELSDMIELRFWLWMTEQEDTPEIVAQAELTLKNLFGSVEAAKRCYQEVHNQPVAQAFANTAHV